MARRNLTVQLDDDVIHRAKTVAAKRGTSVSGLVTQQLERLAEEFYVVATRRYDPPMSGREARQLVNDRAHRLPPHVRTQRAPPTRGHARLATPGPAR